MKNIDITPGKVGCSCGVDKITSTNVQNILDL